MASREFSTLGYERLTNPMLRIFDRKAFIEHKVAEHHYQPPYFREMERLNLEGAHMQEPLLPLPVIEPDALFKSQNGGAVVVDIRSIEAWCAAHVPKSLSIPVKMIPAFAGWFLSPNEAVSLVAAHAADAERAKRHLSRIGFDQVTGYLSGLDGWVTEGRDFESLPMIHADTVRDRLEKDKGDWQLLDVRDAHEVQERGFEQALDIYVGELPAHLDDVPRDRALTVMCGSGQRATVAASVLRRAGFDRVDVFLGSMSAWQATQ
jgi:hydroxyacylglutathione hydrolase